MVNKFFPKELKGNSKEIQRQDIRTCPQCGLFSLKGMPGGIDAICKNCGFKDPCCSD